MVRSYADTLFELAERHGGASGWRNVAAGVGAITDDPVVQRFLGTPRISAEVRKRTLESAVSFFVPPMLRRFMMVVVDRRRQRLMPAIMRDFVALVDRHEGIRRMEVSVARDLDTAEFEILVTRLSDAFAAEVHPEIRVRPGIIGGIVVRDGDTLYDGSIKRQLEAMRRKLMRAELHR